MTNRLYVGNLSFDTTEDRIQQTFAAVGEVTDVKLMLDRDTGRSRGFAFVTMATADEAQKALSQLNGMNLDGRSLRVDQAEERRPREGGGFGGGGGGGRCFGGGGGGGGSGGRGGGGGGGYGGGGRDRY